MPDPEEAFDTHRTPAEIDPSRPEPIETPWGSFAIFSLSRGLVAVQSFCPHMEGPLFQGTLCGETLTCPWHEWRFSLATGERLDPDDDAPGSTRLAFLDVRIGPGGTILLAPRRT
jgi:nitrite reductase/ring-hydroxylating ferredoxin subunit